LIWFLRSEKLDVDGGQSRDKKNSRAIQAVANRLIGLFQK